MVRHYPKTTAIESPDPMHGDDLDWFDRDTRHYARKTIDLPADWGVDEDDATHYIVELFYDETSGGRIDVWEDTKSTLEHIWKPTTRDGGDYKKVEEAHFWDYENAHFEYSNLESATDVVDLMSRNA